MADDQANIPDDFSKLKVVDLKRLCEEKGLPVSGKKSELIERLEQAQEEEVGIAGSAVGLDDTGADHDELDELLKDDEEEATTDLASEKENAKSTSKPISKIVFGDEKTEAAKDTAPKADAEKLAVRANRFGGSTSAEAQKQLRAARFGVTASSNTTTSSSSGGGSNTGSSTGGVAGDVEKLKKRAERFGAITSSTLVKEEGSEKMKQRADRFGEVTAPALSKTEQEERLLKRKQKFGALTVPTSGDLEAAKKRRAERFGLSS